MRKLWTERGRGHARTNCISSTRSITMFVKHAEIEGSDAQHCPGAPEPVTGGMRHRSPTTSFGNSAELPSSPSIVSSMLSTNPYLSAFSGDLGQTREWSAPYSLGLLSDESRPNADERRQVIGLHEASLPCRQTAITGIGRVSPNLSVALSETYREEDRALLMLVQGTGSWGEANRIISDARQNFRGRQVSILQQMDRDLQQRHVAEINQRQRAMDSAAAAGLAMQQANIQQQMINAINRPVTTNCVRTGNMVNCNSF